MGTTQIKLHGLQYFRSRRQDNFFLSIYFIRFSLDTGSRVGFAFKHRENKVSKPTRFSLLDRG